MGELGGGLRQWGRKGCGVGCVRRAERGRGMLESVGEGTACWVAGVLVGVGRCYGRAWTWGGQGGERGGGCWT